MKSQSNSQELKVYHIICEDGIRRELVAKDEVLPAALSCLPEKLEDTHKGNMQLARMQAHNAAIDTMEQNIRAKFQ